MPKVEKSLVVEGSCNTCKYRVSVPVDPNTREARPKKTPSCCFHFEMDFDTNNPSHSCGLYSYSDYMLNHIDEMKAEAPYVFKKG